MSYPPNSVLLTGAAITNVRSANTYGGIYLRAYSTGYYILCYPYSLNTYSSREKISDLQPYRL